MKNIVLLRSIEIISKRFLADIIFVMDFVVIRIDVFTIIMKLLNNIVNNIDIHVNVIENVIVIVIVTMAVDHIIHHRHRQAVIRRLVTANVPINKKQISFS